MVRAGRTRPDRSEIALQVGADSLQDRSRLVGDLEFPAGDDLENVDVEGGRIQHDIAGDLGNVVLDTGSQRAVTQVRTKSLSKLSGRSPAAIRLS